VPEDQDDSNREATPLWHKDSAERPSAAPAGSESAEPPTRVCPKCSAQATTDGTHCPYCGASYIRGGRRLSSRARRALVAVVVLLLVGGGGTAAVLKLQHDSDVRKEREAREARLVADKKRKQEAEVAKRRAAARAEREQAALDRIERDLRRVLEQGLRKEITKSAREAVATGVLDGPIVRTSCDPIAGGVDSLDEPTGRYECLAINQENSDGTAEGYRYTGTINYRKGTYSWRLGDA